MPQTYADILADTLAALEQGETRQAFRILRGIFDYPGLLDRRERWTEALETFARIAVPIAGEEFADLLRRVAADPDDPFLLYDLGYELIDHGLHGPAATVLTRAHSLRPGDERIVTELACALERDGRSVEACEVILGEPELQEQSYLCRYLLAFNRLMCGDLGETRSLLPRLQEVREVDAVLMTRQIEGMIERADAVKGVTPLDRRDLRGWHFVVTGTILLHVSPYGRAEGMNGRYAYTHDSDATCLEGIRRMQAILAELGLTPPRVFALAERASSVLADAAGQVLGVAVEPWPTHGSPQPGLIVAYDLGALEPPVLQSLRLHDTGQVLWAHASCWTDDQPFAVDCATFLHQFNASPWDKHLSVDPATGEARETPAVEGPVESLSRRVMSAGMMPDALADLPDLLALVRAARAVQGEHAAGILRASGARRRHWSGSPVPSNRFR